MDRYTYRVTWSWGGGGDWRPLVEHKEFEAPSDAEAIERITRGRCIPIRVRAFDCGRLHLPLHPTINGLARTPVIEWTSVALDREAIEEFCKREIESERLVLEERLQIERQEDERRRLLIEQQDEERMRLRDEQLEKETAEAPND